jgi:hypothetical protein
MLGQAILRKETSESTMEIDLSKEPKGTYVVRIENTDKQYRILKVIH